MRGPGPAARIYARGVLDPDRRPTDDELAALALAADPNPALPDDAVPLTLDDGDSLLPSWYMPAPMGRHTLRGWRGRVTKAGAIAVIGSFLAITAAGLCNTYGQLHL
jgi:hypothetical protein